MKIDVKARAPKTRTHRFRDLAPKVAGDGLRWVSPDLLKHFSQLVGFAKRHTKGSDEKTIMQELDLSWGGGILPPVARRLVARLLLLCHEVTDGRNVRDLYRYIERHVASLVHVTGYSGRELLECLAERVKSDLQNCRAGYPVSRHSP